MCVCVILIKNDLSENLQTHTHRHRFTEQKQLQQQQQEKNERNFYILNWNVLDVLFFKATTTTTTEI